MSFTPSTIPVPILIDERGVLRVRDTQITLFDIVSRFQNGYTPERINNDFPLLNSADIYAVIAYYLSNKDEADTYVRQQEEETERLRNAREELFEQFGKQMIERVRDKEIQYADMFLDQKMPLSLKYKDELNKLTPAQIEMLKKVAVWLIDGTLHDLFYLLEDANWIKLRLESKNIILENIRQAARGDLQGYPVIWAEKYSKKRLLDI